MLPFHTIGVHKATRVENNKTFKQLKTQLKLQNNAIKAHFESSSIQIGTLVLTIKVHSPWKLLEDLDI